MYLFSVPLLSKFIKIEKALLKKILKLLVFQGKSKIGGKFCPAWEFSSVTCC